MRRIYEIGFIFLLMLVSMNIFITYFAGLVGITVEFSRIAPTEAEIQSIFKSSTEAGSISAIDLITSIITLPIKIVTSIAKSFDIVYRVFFGYEALLDSLYLPVEITNALKDILGTIVIIVITVMGLDIISAIRGGSFG